MPKVPRRRRYLCHTILFVSCTALFLFLPVISTDEASTVEQFLEQADVATITTTTKQRETIGDKFFPDTTADITRSLKKSPKRKAKKKHKAWESFPTSKSNKKSSKKSKKNKKSKYIWKSPTIVGVTPTVTPTTQPTPNTSVNFVWSQLGNTIRGESRGDEAGRSVAMSLNGNIVAVGSPNSGNIDDVNYQRGHVRIFKLDTGPSAWVQLGADVDGETAGDLFGDSVSLSSEGMTVAIGATGFEDSRGYVKIYKWDTDTNSWIQLGVEINGETDGDRCGKSLALSADGMTIAIGSPGHDDNRGHVRIYRWDEDGNNWNQLGNDVNGEANNDLSGLPVSISSDGTIVAIGAASNDGNQFNSDAGHVRVYKWKEDLSSWSQLGQDIDGESADDYSGSSVSLSADGDVVAIGAPSNGDGYYKGHVRIFEWDGDLSAWFQVGTDIDGEESCDFAGRSVSLSSDGKIVAVGAPHNIGNGLFRSGQVRVYKWDEDINSWGQHGNDVGNGDSSFHQFGYSVALSGDGSSIAVGAPFEGGFDTFNEGYVKVYSLFE